MTASPGESPLGSDLLSHRCWSQSACTWAQHTDWILQDQVQIPPRPLCELGQTHALSELGSLCWRGVQSTLQTVLGVRGDGGRFTQSSSRVSLAPSGPGRGHGSQEPPTAQPPRSGAYPERRPGSPGHCAGRMARGCSADAVERERESHESTWRERALGSSGDLTGGLQAVGSRPTALLRQADRATRPCMKVLGARSRPGDAGFPSD